MLIRQGNGMRDWLYRIRQNEKHEKLKVKRTWWR